MKFEMISSAFIAVDSFMDNEFFADFCKPCCVSDLSSDTTHSKISLSWKAPKCGGAVHFYEVEFKRSGKLKRLKTTRQRMHFNKVVPNTSVKFTVRAVSHCGNRGPAAIITTCTSRWTI